MSLCLSQYHTDTLIILIRTPLSSALSRSNVRHGVFGVIIIDGLDLPLSMDQGEENEQPWLSRDLSSSSKDVVTSGSNYGCL